MISGCIALLVAVLTTTNHTIYWCTHILDAKIKNNNFNQIKQQDRLQHITDLVVFEY